MAASKKAIWYVLPKEHEDEDDADVDEDDEGEDGVGDDGEGPLLVADGRRLGDATLVEAGAELFFIF
jgi:hypothetical protein